MSILITIHSLYMFWQQLAEACTEGEKLEKPLCLCVLTSSLQAWKCMHNIIGDSFPLHSLVIKKSTCSTLSVLWILKWVFANHESCFLVIIIKQEEDDNKCWSRFIRYHAFLVSWGHLQWRFVQGSGLKFATLHFTVPFRVFVLEMIFQILILCQVEIFFSIK